MSIQGSRHYLWRAMDQDGDTIAMLARRHRHKKAAKRYFCRLLKGLGRDPWWLVTDRLRTYAAAYRPIMPTVKHLNHVCANNRAEGSHEPTRQQKRAMRGFPHLLTRSGFLFFMDASNISFGLAAISYRRLTIGSDELRGFRFGKKEVRIIYCAKRLHVVHRWLN